MRRPKAVSADDLKHWRHAIADARPLPGRHAPPDQTPPGESPTEKAPAPEMPGAAPRNFAGLEGTIAKRLKRGTIKVDGRLDLHGYRQDEAHGALDRFLAAAEARGARLVIIITGKGRSEGGTLRRLVPLWLREGANRRRVALVAPASPRHGGTGALYVYLVSKR